MSNLILVDHVERLKQDLRSQRDQLSQVHSTRLHRSLS